MASPRGFHENLQESGAPARASDRSFGFVFAGFFAIVAAWPLLAADAPRWWAAAVAAVFLLVALSRPALLAPLNRAWMAFGRLLHAIMSPLIMGLLFFVVVTPVAWLMRCFSKVPLQLRFDPAARSYWIARTPPGPAPDTMTRQF